MEMTRFDPNRLLDALMNFAQRLGNSLAVQDELELWGLQLEPSLVRIQGRLFDPLDIITGENLPSRYHSINAEWSRSLQ